MSDTEETSPTSPPSNTNDVPDMGGVPDVGDTFDASEKFFGRVKWFNNRSGYGFATITGDNRDGVDIFVHHTGITVENEQYKYLVQGEYIEFNLRPSDNEQHPFQADNIRGINGGLIMCETHSEIKKQRSHREKDDGPFPPTSVRQEAREHIHSHGRGPREGDKWFLVKRGRTSNRQVYKQEE